MIPALLVLRSVCRDPLLCSWCGFDIQPFDSAYAISVGDVDLVKFCSYRCCEESSRFHKRGPLKIRYAEVA